MATQFVKDPNAVLDYVFDWSLWLGDTDTISSYSLIVDDGLTVDSDSSTTSTVTVWLSGGTVGQDYFVTCRILTTDGRTDDRTAIIICRNK